jgi:NADH dehydrogenase
VIIGGGFGGLAAARALRTAPIQVTLVDRVNHHLFQPLLYQVATATLSPSDITTPIRYLLRSQTNTRVLLGEVAGIDTVRKVVQTISAAGRQGSNWPGSFPR